MYIYVCVCVCVCVRVCVCVCVCVWEKELNESDRICGEKGNERKIYIGVVLMIYLLFVCMCLFLCQRVSTSKVLNTITFY